MANFNEKVNCGVGYNPNSKEFLIYRRGSIVPCFRIPAEVFEHFFGLNENFPKQYENVFGKTEEAKPVRAERLQSDKIYDAYEIACLMDVNRRVCFLFTRWITELQMCVTKLSSEISSIGVLFMQNIYAVEFNNFGMDLNYEIYDSLSSAKERFNELVSGRRYDMVLLCKKSPGNKSPKWDRIIYRWDSSDE